MQRNARRFAHVATLAALSACGGRAEMVVGSPDTGTETGSGGATGQNDGASDGLSGGPTEPPSCLAGGAGLTNCGGSAESCCLSLAVVGGMFDRTYINTGSGPSELADPAAVSTFRLDKYPVTIGRFRQFVNIALGPSGWRPAAGSGKHVHLNGGRGLANAAAPGTFEPGWASSDNVQIQPSYSNLSCGSFTWTESPGASENLPVGCANWWEAAAFCIWDGGFLPSEAEFAYAAAGGSEQREYPWGSADPGTANQYAVYGCFFPNVGGCSDAPVGTAAKGVGRWGQADLAGEIMQRTLDAYGAYADYAEPCNDCSILMPQGSPQLGAVRGSAPQNPAPDLISTWRVEVAQSTRNGVFGFRCARTP